MKRREVRIPSYLVTPEMRRECAQSKITLVVTDEPEPTREQMEQWVSDMFSPEHAE